MITKTFKDGFIRLFEPVIAGLARLRIKPNWLTTAGLVMGVASGALFGTNHFFWGGLAALLSGLCDALDGSLARRSGNVTTFGMFYDSVLDRYSELAMFIGLSYFYSRSGMWRQVLLTDLALAGSLLVSYTRARAEGLGQDCKVGIMERPERIVVIIAGTILTGIFERHWIFEIALWLLAIFTNITAVQRVALHQGQDPGPDSRSPGAGSDQGNTEQ